MIGRQQIVERARAYVGTPYRHQGRELGVAVDCVGLVLCVADDLGLEDVHGVPFHGDDYVNYSAQPVNAFVHAECTRRLVPVSLAAGAQPYRQFMHFAAGLQPGRVLTLCVPRVPCHMAIVTALQGTLGIVHAYSGAGKVVEHVLSDRWKRRIAGVFEFPNVS